MMEQCFSPTGVHSDRAFFFFGVDQHSVGSDQRPSLWTLLVAHTPTPTHLKADHLAKLIYPNLYG